MKRAIPVLLALSSTAAFAEETRQVDAHEHGVGTLNIAFEGNTVAMEFLAPGADIVGFEYAAESAKDRSAIENAVATLARPSELFVLPEAAECTVTQASAALESEEEHDAHDDDHAKHDDDHDDDHEDHAKHDDDHDDDHDDHAKHDDDHKDDHDDHAKHDDDHEEHAEEAGHTEFHAEYQLTCSNTDAITDITFAYFDAFENAREVEVQIVTASGAKSFEVERDAPVLDLRGLF